MTTKAQKLAALDDEFDSPANRESGKLKLADYSERSAAISAGPDAAPTPVAAKKSLSKETMKLIDATMSGIASVFRPILKTTDERITALEKRVAELERDRK